MKRKRIEIMTIVFVVLCTVVLYVIQNNKIVWYNKNSKDENKSTNVLKTENVANARDGIKGVTQPIHLLLIQVELRIIYFKMLTVVL